MFTKIKSHFKRLWSAAPVATTVLIVALAASAVFGVRSAVFWWKAPPWAERRQEIAAWMTPRYVARSWGLPPRELAEAISAPIPPPDGPMSLEELAAFRGVQIEQVIAEARAAIAAFHAQKKRN
ncbi:MAG: hypothetical protein HKN27_17980 [Silicimonas sp.]|nr:hypothetical protein [Silicimonas sp.]